MTGEELLELVRDLPDSARTAAVVVELPDLDDDWRDLEDIRYEGGQIIVTVPEADDGGD